MADPSGALELLLSIVDVSDEPSVSRAQRILAARGNNVEAAVEAWFNGDDPPAQPLALPAPPPTTTPIDPAARNANVSLPYSSGGLGPLSVQGGPTTTPAPAPAHQLGPVVESGPGAAWGASQSQSQHHPQPPPSPAQSDPTVLPEPDPRRSARLNPQMDPGPQAPTQGNIEKIDLSGPDEPPPYAGENGGADDDAALLQALAASLADVEGTSPLAAPASTQAPPQYSAPAATDQQQPRPLPPTPPPPPPPPRLPPRPAPPARPEVATVQWRSPLHPPCLVASHDFFQPPVALLQAMYALPSVRNLVLGMHLPLPPVPRSDPGEHLAIDVRDLWRGKDPVWSAHKPTQKPATQPEPEAPRPTRDTQMLDAPGAAPGAESDNEMRTGSEPSLLSAAPEQPSVGEYIRAKAGEAMNAAELALLRNVQVLFAYMTCTQRAWIQVPDRLAGLTEGDIANPWNKRWDPTAKSVWGLYGRLARALESYVLIVQSARQELPNLHPPPTEDEVWMLDRSMHMFSLATCSATTQEASEGEQLRPEPDAIVTAVGISGITVIPPDEHAGEAARTVAQWATEHPITYALYEFLRRTSRQLVTPPRILSLFSVGNGVTPASSGGGPTARLIPTPDLALLDDPEEPPKGREDLLSPLDGTEPKVIPPELSATPAPFVSEPRLAIGPLAHLAPPTVQGKREQRVAQLHSELGNLRKWKLSDPKDLLDQSIAYFEKIAAPAGSGATAAANALLGTGRPDASQASRADAAQDTLQHLLEVREGFLRSVQKRQRELMEATQAQAEEALQAVWNVAKQPEERPTYKLAALVLPRGPGLYPPSASTLIRLAPPPAGVPQGETAPAWGHIYPTMDNSQSEAEQAGVSVLSDLEVESTFGAGKTGAVLALYAMELPVTSTIQGADEEGDETMPLLVQKVKQATAEDNTAIITELAAMYQNDDADARAASAAAEAAAQLVASQYPPPTASPPEETTCLDRAASVPQDVEMGEASE